MRNQASWLFAVVVGLAGTGCGSYVPEHPTWKDDIHPLIFARCIRCHHASSVGDPLVPAPYTGGRGAGTDPYNFDYQNLSDLPSANLMILQAQIPAILNAAPNQRMPPTPAAALQDWEKETFARWTKDPRP